jgi:cytosine deaminase
MTTTADLFIQDASLPDGRQGVGLLAREGRIQAIEVGLQPPAGMPVVDAQGWLLSPPFVDAHFHLDATLSQGLPRVNASGTLLEGIALWGELKPLLTEEAIAERALRYCDWAVARGLLAIRSHVDVCDDRLLAVRALLDVKRRVAPYLDLQLVAFPQDGLLRTPGALANLKRALDLGVDVVGGIPHFERTMAEGAHSVRCFASWPLNVVCAWTCIATRATTRCRATSRPWPGRRSAWGCRGASRVASHVHALDGQLLCQQAAAADGRGRPARGGQSADQHHLAGASRQLPQAARHDPCARTAGRRRERGLWPRLRARPLVRAGLGRHAGSGGHGAARGADDVRGMGQRQCFEAVTSRNARILGLQDYGLEAGCRADFCLLQAHTPEEAIRLRAQRLLVVRAGRVLSRMAPATAQLSLPGRPAAVDFVR